MKNLLKKIGLGALSAFLSFGNFDSNSQASAQEKFKPLYGFCYSPYREGQDAEWGPDPTITDIRQDLNMIKSMAYAVRTYGCDGILFNIPGECHAREISCYPGAWIDNQFWDGEQITNLINVGKLNLQTTKGLVVGNEALYRNPGFGAKQIQYVNQVKNETGMPTGCAEQWHIWRDYPSLANACDFLLVHVHPYWENQDVTNAADFVVQKYNYIKSLYPGKPVIIGETGWPCAGAIRGAAVPSTNNQERFIRDLTAIVNNPTNNMKVMWFEFADEPWKARYGTVEANWGELDKNRNLKKGIETYLSTNNGLIPLEKGKLKARTFEKDNYQIQVSTNLSSPTWTTITNYVSAASTNTTEIPLEMTNSFGFYRNVLRISTQ